MKAFDGFDAAKEAAKNMGSERLPVGAYVCQIKKVQYVTGENGNSDRIDVRYRRGRTQRFFQKAV